MTRTISFITATVGAALLFAGPASGDNWGADRRSASAGYLSADGADRATALEQQQLARMLDAREKSQTATHPVPLLSAPYPDVFERAANAAIGDSRGPVVVDDRFDLHAENVPTNATTANSGWDIDVGQVGLGFAIGILLATGLAIGVRYTRLHRLAH